MELKGEGLQVSFGERVLFYGIDFCFSGGELIFLLGKNGAGKTTFLRTLLGMQRPEKGQIFYDGAGLAQMKPLLRSRRMAYMPQKQSGAEEGTVEDYVLLGLTPYLSYFGVPGKKERQRAHQVLEEFQLSHLKHRSVKSLSGGERQLVNFAKAHIQNADWLLLDEPLAGLDFVRQHLFLQQLKDYQRRVEKSILMTAHDPNMALRYGDRILLLHEGRLLTAAVRTEADFAGHLLQVLNAAYGNHLQLIEKEGQSFFDWKEEPYA